jgi:hypothetical protein
MTTTQSYAVSWTADDIRFVGHAYLGTHGLRLAGGGPGGREQLRTLRYEDVREVDVVRVNSHRELALDLGQELFMVASLDGPGSLGELAERLRSLINSGAATDERGTG